MRVFKEGTTAYEEHTHPVIRAIGVTHSLQIMSFDEIFALTAGVRLNLL